ncbi:hypothetical protein Ancab_018346 [Ancistrocladus abbreviatus]
MDLPLERSWYRQSASRITIFAHFFGILTIVLMLVWLLHFRGGMDLDSDDPNKIFNVHPFLMFFGFIFFAGEAMMAYKTVYAERVVQKFVHMVAHLIAITLGIVGIYAVFKYHNQLNMINMYTLHSWLGLSTFILYGIQWLFGLCAFWVPQPGMNKAIMLPWHVCLGRALLYMAICTAETGLMQVFIRSGLVVSHEARLINFTALSVLLFGITVDLSIAFARYL